MRGDWLALGFAGGGSPWSENLEEVLISTSVVSSQTASANGQCGFPEVVV